MRLRFWVAHEERRLSSCHSVSDVLVDQREDAGSERLHVEHVIMALVVGSLSRLCI